MPSSIVVEHNGHRMTFDEEKHSYIDDNGKSYLSVTRLVGMGFEKFDAVSIAKKKALKDGTDWRKLVQEWEENGRRAAFFGTRLHQNCEMQILGNEESLNEPTSPQEKINFDLAYGLVKKMKEDRSIIKLEPEKLVFSPKLGIAGSIDLLAYRANGDYTIFDWKNIKSLDTTGFNGKCGILDATKDLQDSNYWHYALQLQTYELLLKVEEYIPKKASVSRVLNCFIDGRVVKAELPDIMENVKSLIKWAVRR